MPKFNVLEYLKHLFDFRRLFQRQYLPHLNIFLFGLIALTCLAEWVRSGDSNYGRNALLGMAATVIYTVYVWRRQKRESSVTQDLPPPRKMMPLRKKK